MYNKPMSKLLESFSACMKAQIMTPHQILEFSDQIRELLNLFIAKTKKGGRVKP